MRTFLVLTAAIVLSACASSAGEPTVVIPDAEVEGLELELTQCVDVVAAAPGDFEEGCLDSAGVYNLFGVTPCGGSESIVFDADNGGVWFGVVGEEWSLLERDDYTAEFVSSRCE